MTDATAPIPLRQGTLPALAGRRGLAVPRYDREGLVAGVVHLGVGGFHRAHQAMVVDRLLAAGEARDFAICGVGVLPQDVHMAEVMREQDRLYTLVLKHPDGSREARVVGSLAEYLFAPDDPDAVVERMASPEVRIVSLTVTEGGYAFDQAAGALDASAPGVQHDVAHPEAPTTVFGFLCAALRRRRDRGIAPFTVMSCDNIQGNGRIARLVLTGFARLVDPELADWILEHVRFPSSMVDRITPVTTDVDRCEVAERFGVRDGWPVVAEPFFQWVLEDDFGAGRPPYEHAGVQLVGDVEPYERMKLRLLNASHQAMAYFGLLSGHGYAHEATADPLIRRLLVDYMDREVTPTLLPVPGIDLAAYRATLIERFGNPAVRDTLARLGADTSDRIPKWVVPVARENLAAGRPATLAAAICASWARYAEGVDEHGAPMRIVDRRLERLQAAARAQGGDELAFLRDTDLFGDLVEQPGFTGPYLRALRALRRHGAQEALRAVL